MIFYVGVFDIANAKHYDYSFISINRLRGRKSDFAAKNWIMDSGAFSTIEKHGCFPTEPEAYAAQVERWSNCGGFECAVSQDYMCEPKMLKITGLTVRDHQRLTIDRYKAISGATFAPVMPVIQGYTIPEYLSHIEQYGELLQTGMRVGIGSVCKRNGNITFIEDIVGAVNQAAPGLLLHGFGLKTTALKSDFVWRKLYSADSMAWSTAAWKQGRNNHDPQEAANFVTKINTQRRCPRYPTMF